MTTIYVTHDQTEAMTLGQRVAVMRDGAILQVDAPQELYAQPRDLFVAAFIGSPAMNLVEATVEGDVARFGQFRVPLDPAACRPQRDGPRRSSESAPRRSTTSAFAPGELPTIDVALEVVEELGADTHVCFWVDAPRSTRRGVAVRTTTRRRSSALARRRSSPPGSTRARVPASAAGSRLAVDPARLPLLRSGDGRAGAAPDVEVRARRAVE